MSKQIRKLDALVAEDLGLSLGHITMVLKHAVQFVKMVEGFVFVYELDGLTHYDTVPVWRMVNGMRVRVPRFQSHPIVEERLAKRQYRRWYVWGDGFLYPVQTSKVEDLKENFYFITDDDPRYRTTTILLEECQWIRRKALMFHHTRVGLKQEQS